MPRKIPINKIYISLFLVAIIGLGLSLTAFFYVKQWELNQALENQKKQVNEYVRVLRQTFTTYSSILHSIKGLYLMHHSLTQPRFTQFVKNLLIPPGVVSLEWVGVVPANQRHSIEEERGFRFWESPHDLKRTAEYRETYYPVLLAHSINDNIERLGYDVGSNTTLALALEMATKQGQLTASGATKLFTNTDKFLGFYVFLPVYQQNTSPSSPENLIGFAVGVFRLQTLVEQVLRLPKLRTKVFLRILDETQKAPRPELYAPAWYHDPAPTSSVEIWSASLEFGGRLWRLVFYNTQDKPLVQIWYAFLVLGVGGLFTLGLLRYLYIILIHAQWAEQLVAKRTQSLYAANQALNQEVMARKQMTKALETSRQRFQAIFNEAAIGIAQTQLDHKIIESNRALQMLFRYRETELQDNYLNELAHPEDAHLDQFMLEKMLAGRYDTYQVSKRYICKNGTIVWTNQSCSIVRDTVRPFLINMIEDITERKLAEQARLEAEKKFRDIFENAIEGIFQCTPSGRYLSVNPAFVRMFGYESAEQVYAELVDIGQQLYLDPQRRLEFIALLENHSNVQDFEYQARCRNGQVIWVNETVRVVRDSLGQIRYYEGMVEDVTGRKQTEQKLRHDATHDQLTGLFNRAAFTSHLTEALAQLTLANSQYSLLQPANPQSINLNNPTANIPFAVLFIDLDRFKVVNDSMGHLVGDQLLSEIAHRLETTMGENNVVARFGGDEFVLLLENIADFSELEQTLDDIQQQLSQPYLLNQETFNTTASIGVALGNRHYNNADEVLRDADTAMYEAKKQGGGKWVIFQPAMRDHVISVLRIEKDLRLALERQEFCVYYQPIVSLETCKTVGLEALVRWVHPKQGLIRPDLFIPIAEETGLIKELGLWVFETACVQLRRWQIQFAQHASLGMNINVSPIQLKHPRLVAQIQDILEKTGIQGTTCRVEITESAMMQDPKTALTILNDLKSLEVLLYIDDFGTGYSSLSYLQKFPIDALKIDKSFIQEIDTSGKSAQIANAIIALGEAFDLRVVAEGIETSCQVAKLKAAHCHHGQGYLFSRPQDEKSIEKYLSS